MHGKWGVAWREKGGGCETVVGEMREVEVCVRRVAQHGGVGGYENNTACLWWVRVF